MRRAGLVLALLLAGCEPQAAAPTQNESRAAANPERYARDRDLCRAQIDESMKTRRNVDDSRREVFSGNYDRYGQGDLPRDMAEYGDTRRADRLIASCMEARGWPQPQRAWWQR